MCNPTTMKAMRSAMARVGSNLKQTQVLAAQVHTGQQQGGEQGQQGRKGGKKQQRAGVMAAGATLMASGAWGFSENRKVTAEEQEMLTDMNLSEKVDSLALETITTKPMESNSNRVKIQAKKMGGYDQSRIREFSAPDQTFHYFSSYLLSQHTNFEDKASDYDLKKFKTLNQEDLPGLKMDQSPVENSVLNQIGYNGLIAYNDFCFLLTLLSSPRRYISTAFELFDINGDGLLDSKEFAYASSKMAYNAGGFGDYQNTLNTARKHTIPWEQVDDSDSGVLNYLFGKDRTKTLDSKHFIDFIIALQDEIIELEFREYDTTNTGRITEEVLGHFLLKNAKIPTKLHKRMMNRIKKAWPADQQNPGVSLASFKNLYQALMAGEDLQKAMYFLDQGKKVGFEEFQKIFKIVSKQELKDNVAKVMFVLFDDDSDGKITSHDVQNVLCNWRKSRGFEKLLIHASVGQVGPTLHTR